jgi:PadR family transcriptional regulator PadR
MPHPVFIGEFEQLVMLALLTIEDEPYALRLREELNKLAGRNVSRGALYRTLDRLEDKGYLNWETEEGGEERRGHVRRRLAVTEEGREVLRASRDTLMDLWDQVGASLQ